MPQSLNHRYQLHSQLGQGGMGIVYKALDQLSGETIALKQVIVSPDNLQFASMSSESEGVLALALEFRTLASLRHPHIVSVLDYGFDAQQQPFYTMQLIEEARTIIEYGEDLTLDEKIDLLIEVLQALTYLHRRGIIHRDLKPANVLVTAQKSVKVMDFGLALNQGEPSTKGVAGTLAYMAPELFTEEVASIQSDLYAVGMIAYELIVGHHPFNVQDTATLVNSIFAAIPDTTSLDSGLAAVLDKLMLKDPSERYANAQTVIADLCIATKRPLPTESAVLRESFLQASTFIGRDNELEQLKVSLGSTMQGHGASWLVGGESGIGKSRLLDEIRTRALVRGALVLRGQAIAEGGLPYQLWRDVLRHLILAIELSPLEASVLKAVMPDIGSLLGRDVAAAAPLDAAASVQRLSLTIVDVFKRQTQPIVLILEDLHWASESLEPLKQLNKFVQEYPWLIIGSYRDDEAPDVPQRLPGMQVMKLARLSDASIADLSAGILGEAGKQSEIIELLTRETEGNAFFMVEMVRVLAEEAGALSAIGQVTLPQNIMTGGVQAIVRRRLERVPIWAQPVLKLAAIVGRQLDLSVLKVAEPDVVWDAWLNACAEAAVLDISDNIWRFSHDKLRETLLSDIPDADEPILYRRVAEAIETAYPNDDMQSEGLMENWYKAGDVSKTLLYTRQSVERLVRLTADTERAAPLIERGLLLAQEPEQSHHLPYLHALFGALWFIKSNFELAQEHYKAVEATAQDNPPLRIQILNELSSIDWRRGQFEGAQKSANDALSMAKTHNDRKGIASALNNLAIVANQQGQFAEARSLFEESLLIRQELGDLRDIAASLGNFGVNRMLQGDYTQAEELYTQSMEIRRQIGDRYGTAATLNNMASIAMYRGYLKKARLLHEESLEIRRQTGDKHNMSQSMSNLGNLAINQGDYVQAQTYYKEALSILREMKDLWGISNTLDGLGCACVYLGNYEEGERAHQEALLIQRQMENRPAIAVSIKNLGVSAYLQGNYEQAQTYLNESLALRREIDAPQDVAMSLVEMANLAMAQNDFEQARKLTDESLALHRELKDQRGLIESLANLGFIHLYDEEWKVAASAWHESLTITLEVEAIVQQLHILAGIAIWHCKQARYEASAQLAGLLEAHPVTRADTKTLYLSPLLRDLKTHLDEAALSKARSFGAASDLDEVIKRTVSELVVAEA